jgi:hypothetical protein
MTMNEVEIKIGKEWCRVHGRTAAIVADGRHLISDTATSSLCYWVLQLMLHGY